MGRAEIDSIVEAIQRYLLAHPSASDTADGVGRWWLSAEHMEVSPEAVAAALQRLADAGVVECRRVPNGITVYSAPRHAPPLAP